DDLHWLDPASEAALEMLTGRLLAADSADCRALLLATTRPEYRPSWPTQVERLSLMPLASTDSQALLGDWLGSGPSLAPLRARIEARAGGNPLFIEEIVRSLVERGALHGAAARRAPCPSLRGSERGSRGRTLARARGPARRAQRPGGWGQALPPGDGAPGRSARIA